MPKQAAGIVLYRFQNNQPEIFLMHPGGPFYKNKEEGVWQTPKGEFEEREDAFAAAKREFKEETGQNISGDFVKLKPIKYKSGKIVYAWAIEGNINAEKIISNTFSLEWPPRSGKFIEVPEADRGGWFDLATARKKITPSLLPLIDQLEELIKTKSRY